MTRFTSEFARRNIFRAAATNALAAWIIIEAGSVLLPTFGAPEWAFQTYVIVVICGFILSLIFAWISGITSDGEFKPDTDRSEPAIVKSPARANLAIISLLALALTISITFNLTGIRNNAEPVGDGIARRSIAVLPFQNRSTDPENTLFADGIHDDLLTKLANNKALRVISRTSVMQYRDNNTRNIREIGEELNVDTLLEGAVQRNGDSVRITMQLIDARTDEHLWAKVYDREMTMQDLFAIQSDISTAISNELRATLTPEDKDRIARIPTNNLVAYNLFTKARGDMARRQLKYALSARQQFEEAIELDPDFAEAHAGLATSILLLYINDKAIEYNEAFSTAERELDIALALNPDLADAYATVGLLKLQVWQETHLGNENIEAAVAFTRALELNPNHASAYMWFATLRQEEGSIDEAIALFEKSKEVDPLGRIPYVNLPTLYAQLGENDEALRQLIRATEIHPEWPTPYLFIANQLNALGRVDESLAWLAHAQELSVDSVDFGNLDVGIYLALGETDRAKKVLHATPSTHPLANLVDALSLLIDGDVRGSLTRLLEVVEASPNQPTYIFNMVSNIALLAKDLDTAKKYSLRYRPVLAADAELVVDSRTVRSIVQLAYIEKQQGDKQKAEKLLARALSFVQRQPRMGVGGHGILDVQIFAIQGRIEDAISAFRAAVAEGFRGTVAFDFWPIDHDPYLDAIRDDARFVEIRNTIEVDMQRMRDNAIKAEQSGDWEALRQIAIKAAKSDILAQLDTDPRH